MIPESPAAIDAENIVDPALHHEIKCRAYELYERHIKKKMRKTEVRYDSRTTERPRVAAIGRWFASSSAGTLFGAVHYFDRLVVVTAASRTPLSLTSGCVYRQAVFRRATRLIAASARKYLISGKSDLNFFESCIHVLTKQRSHTFLGKSR
jgi:hypothetical protein